MKKDQIYEERRSRPIADFAFDESVAMAFDDMAMRSIPFYGHLHALILDIVHKLYRPPHFIYDLGAATGTTLTLIDKCLKEKGIEGRRYVAIDYSWAMLDICRQKIRENKILNIDVIQGDIRDVEVKSASIVIMNYTLHFLPPSQRPAVLKRIFEGLVDNGVLILSEKIKGGGRRIDGLMEDLYGQFKRRNGYSELAIAQKRTALENVLIPLTPKAQMGLLKEAGFEDVDMMFRWNNFASFIGIK